MSEIAFMGSGDWSEPITYVGMYSDDTPMVKSDKWAEIVARADTMVLRPKSLNDFVVGMFLADAITANGGWITKLILPYIPGARQDRSNPTGDVLFTAASVARMINDRRFSRVVVLDPHSPVSNRLINNIRVFPLEKFATLLPHADVIAPDKGGVERATRMAKAMDSKVIKAEKVRDVSTGRLSGFDVTVQKGHHYLVVDDICDGGGTFVGLGEKIKEQGATADLYVSHGIFSKGTTELKKYYQNIYTTDSRDINERNDVTIIPVLDEMRNY